MHVSTLSLCSFVVLLLSACQAPPPPMATGRWEPLQSGTTSRLRGLHAVDSRTVWASGSGGTVLRSTDGGETFRVHVIPGEAKAEIRDVHGFDGDTALVIACQPARIYRTTDGGSSFERVYDAGNEKAFFDGLSFFDRQRGVVFGDPVGDRFMVLTTEDGGSTWRDVPATSMPAALPGEGGFAASGTCLTVSPDGRAWIGTGIAGARVLHSADFGRTWSVATTPMAFGERSGIFSLAFHRGAIGVAVGGDYQKTDLVAGNAATTLDGGASWTLVEANPPRGYRSCAVFDPRREANVLAVGPTGTDYSTDAGRSWQALTDEGYDTVSFAADGACFASGSKGRIARLVFPTR